MKNLPSDRAVEIIADEDPNVSDDWFKNAHLMSVRVAALALDWSVDDLAVRVAKFVSQETEEDEAASSVDKLVRSIEFVFKDDITLDDYERETVKNLILRWAENQDHHVRGYSLGYASALTAIFMKSLRETEGGSGPLSYQDEIDKFELSTVLDLIIKHVCLSYQNEQEDENDVIRRVRGVFGFKHTSVDIVKMLRKKLSESEV